MWLLVLTYATENTIKHTEHSLVGQSMFIRIIKKLIRVGHLDYKHVLGTFLVQ